MTAAYGGETAESFDYVYIEADKSSVFLDFEAEWADTDWNLTYTNKLPSEVETRVKRTNEWSMSGSYSYYIIQGAANGPGKSDGVKVNYADHTKMGMWINAPQDGTLQFYFNNGTYLKENGSTTLNIKAGVHYYVFDLDKSKTEFTLIWLSGSMPIYLDDIALLA